MEDRLKISQSKSIKPDNPGPRQYGKRKQKRRKPYRDAKKNLTELTQAVDDAHKELEQSNSPFRLCIYQEGEDIYIDVVTVDDNGTPKKVFRHDISHDEIQDLVYQIKSGTGLIFDVEL